MYTVVYKGGIIFLKPNLRNDFDHVAMPWTIMQGHTEQFFLLWTGGKCNELLIIYCIVLLFFLLAPLRTFMIQWQTSAL